MIPYYNTRERLQLDFSTQSTRVLTCNHTPGASSSAHLFSYAIYLLPLSKYCYMVTRLDNQSSFCTILPASNLGSRPMATKNEHFNGDKKQGGIR